MVKWTALFVYPLLLLLGITQTNERIGARGSIHGIVLDSDGNPAKGIALVATPLEGALGALLPATRTTEGGAYRFRDIPWWGRFTVSAEDDEAGYSEFSTGASGHNPPQVTLDSDHPEAELNVRLPRKAGFLYIDLIDKSTGQSIPIMEVELRKPADPTKFLFSMGCSSDNVVLIPPDENVLIHVSSKGYKEWSESVDKGRFIHIPSGTQQRLTVELIPIT